MILKPENSKTKQQLIKIRFSPRLLFVSLQLITFSLILFISGCSDKDTEGEPNIVFIHADDLWWAGRSVYGNKFNQAPNLERMASEGIQFMDAHAAGKLIHFLVDDPKELYNLETDTGETSEMSSINKEKFQELSDLPDKWKKEMDAQFPGKNPDFDPEKQYTWERHPDPGKLLNN